MIEKTTRIISENLARALDRRAFVRRAGEATFAGLAALAAGRMTPAFAVVGRRPKESAAPRVPRCSPPGPYCNITGVNNPDGCHGGSCFQHLVSGQIYQCRVYYQWYAAGCWTTADSGGYWTCCDCECGNPRVASCGCAQFNLSPQPRPDRPGAGISA